MSLAGKKSSNIFIVFIVILLYTETVTSSINYNEIRNDYHPYGDQAEVARTTRQILNMINNRALYRPILNFQQATEHFLHFGALLRIQILDIFGPLVYDHHGDYNDQQTGALHRVYQETLEKKYNIFNIVPSILRNPDIRPTNLCRHIHKYVHTCLKESSVPCMTINKNDHTHMQSSLVPILNVTKQMYKRFYIKERFSNGFSLPAILDHLKSGTLKLTFGLISGLVHNIQYDNFDDEVRTSERNVMIILKSEMFGSDAHKVLMKRDSLLHMHTVSDLFKELSRLQRNTRRTAKTNANFATISEHVVDEVSGINENIVLLSTVYDGNKIDMKYLLDLILPPDVVDEDITDAKNYLLEKINDYNIVDQHLEIDKYQYSSPDQLLLEILGQMIDIDFAVDIVTALHVHAHFWQQSHMINNLDALLWLFDAYKNLKNVPEYSSFMSLTDKIRNNLRDSNNVTVEISCNNPRVCLRLGLETVIESEFIDVEIKNDIDKLFHYFNELKVIHNAGECTPSIESVEKSDELQTEKNPTRINGEDITDRNHREELGTTEVSTVETASMESEETSMPTINAEDTTTVLTTEGNASSLTTTDIFNEFLTINTEDTSIQMTTLSPQDATETMEHQTTDSIDEELITTSVTITKPVFPDVSNELTTETQGTTSTEQESERLTEQSTTDEELRTQETTSTEHESERLTEQSTTDEELRTQETTTREQRISEEEITTQETATTELKSTESTEQSSSEEETRTTPGESTIESMIADATIIPKNDDDCHGNPCTPKISNDPIAILDGDVWQMVPWHSTSPPLSQYNTGVAETLPLTTTTVIPTTRENLMMTTTVPAVTTTSSSAFASGEDCSGEACTSNDCFGVGCRPHASSEVINESTDCSDGTNCNINGQTDCNEDGSCITDSSTDQCDDNNCKTNTDEQNYQHDCSGDNCLSTVEVSEKTDGCEGDDCSRPSSERDDLSTGHSLTDSKIPDCVDDDCSEVSKSNESTCNDDTCVNSDESQPSSGMQETDPAFPASTPHSVPRDNEDSVNTPRATTPTPPDRTGDKLGEADIPEKLPSPKPTRRVPIKFQLKLPSQKLPLWLRLPRNKISDNYSPWRPTTQQPLQTHGLKKEEFGHQSLGFGIKNRTSSKALLNINTNINVSGQRQYTDKDTENVTTPGPDILQMMNSSNSSYRRVVTEVPNGLGSDKKDQKSNLELKVQAEKSRKISRRRQVSPMKTKPDVYRRKGSDDKIERMKKRRSSTIRASQRPSMRYLR